jgi:hypothetical protein
MHALPVRAEFIAELSSIFLFSTSKGHTMQKQILNRTATGVKRLAMATAVAATLASTAVTATTSTSTWCGNHCDEIVIDWSLTAYQTIKADNGYIDPLPATRALAMMHLAMHDALNLISPRYQTYAPHQQQAEILASGSQPDAAIAAASAAHNVLLALFPKQKIVLDATLEKLLLEAGNGASVSAAKAIGAKAAAAVAAVRANDGSDRVESYSPGTRPGEYRFVPGFNFLSNPQWRSVTPFALTSPRQFRVNPPPALGSSTYTRDFNEVKATGSAADNAARSADQTQYAIYWEELADIGWNRIARVVSRQHKQNLWQRARTFALLNAALADSYIAGWDSKMHYNFWRPVTAIQLGDIDGNAATLPDTTWSPLLLTPPIQDHPSTHSTLGAAAATVLAEAFGHDRISFSMASSTAKPESPIRQFESFSAAAIENADSRVRGGLHFRFATVDGLALGHNIGRYTTSTLLPRSKASQH